jgi:IS1 family transposase
LEKYPKKRPTKVGENVRKKSGKSWKRCPKKVRQTLKNVRKKSKNSDKSLEIVRKKWKKIQQKLERSSFGNSLRNV